MGDDGVTISLDEFYRETKESFRELHAEIVALKQWRAKVIGMAFAASMAVSIVTSIIVVVAKTGV